MKEGMLSAYFRMHKVRLVGMISESGVPVWLVILMTLASPIALIWLYSVYQWMPYAVLLSLLAPLLNLSSSDRNVFLKGLFKERYLAIRFSENALLALPFILALSLSGDFLIVLFAFEMAALAAFFTVKLPSGLIIPTPFSKAPFEFMIGWRKRWYAYVLVLVALAMAWQLDNVNFAFFAQAISMLLAMLNYAEPEPPYYIWMHRCSPKQFLMRKIAKGTLHAQYTGALVLLIFALLFPKLILVAATIQVVASIYLVAVILAKYVAYPRAMSFPQAIKLAIALWFPPFLLYLIPTWFKEASINLQKLLK